MQTLEEAHDIRLALPKSARKRWRYVVSCPDCERHFLSVDGRHHRHVGPCFDTFRHPRCCHVGEVLIPITGTETQYRVAKSKAERLAAAQNRIGKDTADLDPLIQEAMVRGIEGQLAGVQQEIAEYEAWVNETRGNLGGRNAKVPKASGRY